MSTPRSPPIYRRENVVLIRPPSPWTRRPRLRLLVTSGESAGRQVIWRDLETGPSPKVRRTDKSTWRRAGRPCKNGYTFKRWRKSTYIDVRSSGTNVRFPNGGTVRTNTMSLWVKVYGNSHGYSENLTPGISTRSDRSRHGMTTT